jgi:hypothetical protein
LNDRFTCLITQLDVHGFTVEVACVSQGEAIEYEIPAEGADKYTSALAAHRSIGANRASEPDLRIGIREHLGVNIGERFPGIRFDECLLVCSAMNSSRTASEMSVSMA